MGGRKPAGGGERGRKRKGRSRGRAGKPPAAPPPEPEAGFSVAEIRREVVLPVPRARAWKALVEEIGEWWLPGFFAGKEPRRMVLEPFPGGRLYEDWGDSQGLVWYTVLAVRREERLVLAGDITPDYGGPVRTLLTLTLEDRGGKTAVLLVDSVWGRVARGTVEAMTGGWRMLLEEGLARHVAGKG